MTEMRKSRSSGHWWAVYGGPLVIGDDFALVGFDENAYRRRFES